MLLALAALWLPAAQRVVRDQWGVPHIKAGSAQDAWFDAGYAVAQDRLWQMEMSRRIAEGRMSEAFGPKYVEADTETLQTGYTRSDLQTQYGHLGKPAREALDNYAKGANAWISEARKDGHLPTQYGENHLDPRPWEALDSIAINISLMQRFGKGASGQLRNLAAVQYLKAQPALKTRYLDAFDDLAWENDPAAPTTVAKEDDHGSAAGLFAAPTRAQTEGQLSQLPQLSLMELLPALKALNKPTATLLAEAQGAPFKVGSYAMVVSPSRSTTGRALLLSGPQMGFSNPSVVHEIAIKAPGIEVTGMDVPGVPGVMVGATPNFAWGLTSGVADTDDVFVYDHSGPTQYREDGRVVDLERVQQDLPIAGQDSKHLEQFRTHAGPVVLSTKTHVFARRSAYWMREMKAYEALLNLYTAKTPDEIERAIRPAPMSFNFFYATTKGQTGFVYIGDVPIRAPGLDPRLPTPYSKANDWRGMIPKDRMPHVRNPKSGLITNWNTKPATWWPNLDTPVWGEIDHVNEIRNALGKQKLSADDLRSALLTIATREPSWSYFQGVSESFKGNTDSPEYPIFMAFLDSLRKMLFVPKVGGFLGPDYLRLAFQPTLIWRATRGDTKINYLEGRSVSAVFTEAILEARKVEPHVVADQIVVPGIEPIRFRNRGTFIQVVELTSPPMVQTILPPGEGEAGAHRTDQAALARAFGLKPMDWRQ